MAGNIFLFYFKKTLIYFFSKIHKKYFRLLSSAEIMFTEKSDIFNVECNLNEQNRTKIVTCESFWRQKKLVLRKTRLKFGKHIQLHIIMKTRPILMKFSHNVCFHRYNTLHYALTNYKGFFYVLCHKLGSLICTAFFVLLSIHHIVRPLPGEHLPHPWRKQ